MRTRGLVLIAVVWVSVPVAAETELHVASILYPPYLEADGVSGMTYELLAEALGPQYRLVVEVLPPARAQADFEAGRFGMTLYVKDYSYVPGASQSRMYNARLVFLARAADSIPPWSKLSDLGGKTLGVTGTLESSAGPIKVQLQTAGLSIFNIKTLEQGLLMLKTDRLDLVFADALAGWTMIHRLFPNSQEFTEVSPPFLVRSGGPWFHTRVPGGAQAALDYQKGFKVLVQSGRAKAILEKYLGPGRVPDGILYEEPGP